MSSSSSRKLEIWISSEAKDLSPINGAFFIQIVPSIMVRQTLQFLYEKSFEIPIKNDLISGFILGMNYYKSQENSLIWYKSFANYHELIEFDIQTLTDAIRQLEIHADINITYSQINYLADVGSGPNLPLLVINRIPLGRGVSFEVEERGIVHESILYGDFYI